MRLAAAALCLLCLPSPLRAQTTLYVDAAAGNDKVSRAANSASSPWRTIGRAAWGSVDRGTPNPAEAAQPGDTVLVAAGTYSASAAGKSRYIPLYNPANSGTESHPIAFRAQGRVSLESPEYAGPVIGAHQREHVVWDGFYIDESLVNTTPDTGPVVVWASSYVTIENLEIVGKFAAYLDNHNGIRLEAADHNLIRGNLISGIGVTRNGQQMRTRNAAAIMLYDSNHNVIEHNELHSCGVGVFVKGVNQGRGQDGTVIRFNEMSRMGMASTGVGVTLQTSSNARVYQNLFHDLDVAVEIEALEGRGQHPVNDIVANNTIYNVALAAFWLRGTLGWENVRVHNNLVVRSRRHVVWGESAGEPGDISFEHNVYAEVASDFANLKEVDRSFDRWKKDFGTDRAPAPSSTASPRLADPAKGDFRLCTGRGQPAAPCSGPSPALDQGVDLLDLDGDGSTSDAIHPGAFLTGDEVVGRPRRPAR